MKLPVEGMVSIIIPAYNVEQYVEEAIHSALKQTFDKLEVIVVDDCSTDNTVHVINRITDPRLKLIRNLTNKGVSYSRNKAIQAAIGEWIAIMDSDDWWSPDRLEKLLQHAAANEVDILCDDLWLIHDGAKTPYSTHLKSRVRIIGQYLEPTLISAAKMVRDDYGYLKPIIRSEVIKQPGFEIQYDEKLNGDEDFKFLVECIYRSKKMLLIPEPMYYYRTRTDSLSTTLPRAIKLHQSQIRFTGELITQYRHDPDLVNALQSHRRKKQKGLTELLLKDRLEKKRYRSALFLCITQPFLFRVLLRNSLGR